jgi:hypothetical protein
VNTRTLNDGDHDMYKGDRRAPRERPPLLMTRAERQRWRAGQSVWAPPRQSAQVRLRREVQEELREVEAPPVQVTRLEVQVRNKRPCRPKPPRVPRNYMLAWRDEWGSAGLWRRLTLERADQLGVEYNTGRRWAGIIDARTFTILREFGTRFAELPAMGLVQRKTAGRENEQLCLQLQQSA